MKALNHTLRLFSVVATMLIAVSCSNETDPTLTSQQESIVRYLTGSHQPRLIAEAELGTTLDEEPAYYSQWGLDLFRYISTMYAEGRDSKHTVVKGNKLSITYTAYIFSGGSPTVDAMYATNDPESIAKLEESGLNTEYEWSSEPMSFTLGEGEILGALEVALEGCKEGDSVEVYLTFENAYGNNYIGKVPAKSAVVWFIDIVSAE